MAVGCGARRERKQRTISERQTRYDFPIRESTLLSSSADGQTTESTVATDPLSGKVLKINVSLAVLK
jgi:hypothetical protein